MLELRNLTKRYGSRVAVDQLNLTLRKGERFGLVGPNGAGKTTTISMLVGVLAPDAGEILFEGQPLRSESDPVKCRLGYVPQELALFEELTAQPGDRTGSRARDSRPGRAERGGGSPEPQCHLRGARAPSRGRHDSALHDPLHGGGRAPL